MTTREVLQTLQQEVRQLKTQQSKTNRILREHGLWPSKPSAKRKSVRKLSERERAIEILRRAGAIREMTPAEEKLAAEWDALSDEEKREVEESLRRVQIDPPLSQLIHDMRR